ncbi:hypothetical protein G9A89_002110 [Geosiphon pyriformis]|nr:hypothetical protein G9A89_002110 [Geosiphon pyriformis]
MNFGLTDRYQVHNGLNQGEVFSSFLWCIFYDPLLCEVKRQKSVYRYRLDFCFVTRTGCSKSQTGLTSFLAAGAFVNDTIWIDSSQATTQHIFKITSKFFQINDISINNNKMAHLNVWFFTNLVLRKTIFDKQFLYLVLAILHPIVVYRIQISFVSINVCVKWDTMIHKGLKSKSGLPHDFLNDAIYYSSLYSLKSFKQIQAKDKPPAVCNFLLPYIGSSNILKSHEFKVVYNCLLEIDSGHLSLFINGSLNGLGTLGMKAGAAVFFENIDLNLGMRVFDQTALEACKSESMLICLDFRNWCWIKHCHIADVIRCKNLDVNWIKIKGHSGVLGNECANIFARAAAFSDVYLPHMINEHFLRAGDTAIGSGSQVLVDSLHDSIDWSKSSLMWHSNFHLAAGFTSARTAGFQMYFMKTLYYHLLVAVRKRFYNRSYSSVVCLFCSNVEVSNHVFSCPFDAASCAWLVKVYVSAWEACSDLFRSSLCVSQLLFTCIFNVGIGTALCKSFVFKEWYHEFVAVFKDFKIAA